MTALEREGALRGAVDGRIRSFDYLQKATTFSVDRQLWRQRWTLASPLFGVVLRATTSITTRRLASLDENIEVLLQLGAWHDFATRGPASRYRASYHDGNLATMLRRPDSVLPQRAPYLERALKAEQKIYDGIVTIFTMSEWLRRSFIDDFRQDPNKVVAVGAGPNRLSATAYRTDAATRPPRILFVGKDFERKGGPELLAAFRDVRLKHPEAELWIVGPRAAPVAAEGVRFFGRLSSEDRDEATQLDDLFREATIFAMPSHYEPFGIVFLEAMMHSLPCIASTECAMPEIVVDGVTGFVVEPGSTTLLVERLSYLVANPELAARLGDAGRRRVEENFQWELVARRMIDRLAADLEPQR